MTYSPVLVFVYNRADNAKKTLEALEKNELAKESIVYIFSDGPKGKNNTIDEQKVSETRAVLKTNWKFKEVNVIERKENWGIYDNLTKGVKEIVNKFGKVIVIEDDILTSKNFLLYMNKSLQMYEKEYSVMQISGYQFPSKKWKSNNQAIFLPHATSWGWGTWSRAWNKLDHESQGAEILKKDIEKNKAFNLGTENTFSNLLFSQTKSGNSNDWDIRWWWTIFNSNGLVLHPDSSLVRNIGFGEDATHTKIDLFKDDQDFLNYSIKHYPKKIEIDKKKKKKIFQYFSKVYDNKPTLLQKLKYYLNPFEYFRKFKLIIINKLKYILLSDENIVEISKKITSFQIKENLSSIQMGEKSILTSHAEISVESKDSIRIGDQSLIEGGLFTLSKNALITVGNNTVISRGCKIITKNKIQIGDNVSINLNTIIINNGSQEKNITIEDNVKIGCNVTILQGAIIKENSKISSGSIVK